MATLTIDVYSNYSFGIDYVHLDARLYDNETKQTLSFIKTGAVGSTAATAVRVGEFPGLSRKVYTVIVQLLDVNFRPVGGRIVIVSMINDRVTRVYIRR